MIDLIDVDFKYNDSSENVLKKVNLRINNGEFAFIVGASGAGKSSLLKLLLRETTATSGQVIVNGYNLGRIKENQIPNFRRSIGVVFQDFRLIDNMTVYENVAFAMRIMDASPKKIRERVPYVLDLVGLKHKARMYPRQLSGGEQQRVAVARALVNDPPLIIADEPTGNVDPERSLEIVELLRRVNKCGTTVLMVTHEHDLVKFFGGRTINIEDGVVKHDGYVGGQYEEQ